MTRSKENQFRWRYVDDYPDCELGRWLHIRFDQHLRMSTSEHPVYVDGQELNHIWSLGVRLNVRANVIHLDKHAHTWFHANPREGRVACLLAKARKLEDYCLRCSLDGLPEDHADFLLQELDEAAGKSALGFVRCFEFSSPLHDRWHSELVERMQRIRFKQHMEQPE